MAHKSEHDRNISGHIYINTKPNIFEEFSFFNRHEQNLKYQNLYITISIHVVNNVNLSRKDFFLKLLKEIQMDRFVDSKFLLIFFKHFCKSLNILDM